jgi:hypothetical protein
MVLEGKGYDISFYDESCSCGAIGFVMPAPLPKGGQELLDRLVFGPKVAQQNPGIANGLFSLLGD